MKGMEMHEQSEMQGYCIVYTGGVDSEGYRILKQGAIYRVFYS